MEMLMLVIFYEGIPFLGFVAIGFVLYQAYKLSPHYLKKKGKNVS